MLESLSYLYHDERGNRHSFYRCSACSCVVLRRDMHARSQATCKCTPSRLRHGGERGRKKTPEFRTYQKMRERCTNPNSKGYENYGGRGIVVDPRWDTFEAFLADMGPRPSPGHSIERNDVNGPYSPDNCRWATKREQARNTRANDYIVIGPFVMAQCGWLELLGVPRGTFAKRRARGLSNEQALGLL